MSDVLEVEAESRAATSAPAQAPAPARAPQPPGGGGSLDRPDLDHVVTTFEGELLEDYSPPNIKRHAHPKMHGCVQAVLRVATRQWLEKHGLCHGIFSRPDREYLAWVRFSNAFGIQHDMKFESRGMAIKVLGVEGERLLPGVEPFTLETDTQDFVMAVHDAFVLPNTTQFDYTEFAKAARAGFLPILRLFLKKKLYRGLIALIRGGLATARNPLAIRYFSQTAYMFGQCDKVKISARPVFTRELRRSLPNVVLFHLRMVAANVVLFLAEWGKARRLVEFVGLSGTREGAELFVDRHLGSKCTMRVALSAYLASHPAQFEILVQKQTDPERMPDDNPTVRWKGSPFVRVATLTIPRQVFWPAPGMPTKILRAAIDMVDLGEDISYSPWHGLKDHKPLGDINQARGRIYRDLSKYRHKENDAAIPSSAVLHAEYERLKPIVQDGLMEPQP
jgi:hypothetical protein